jgi:hypothetical protein
MVAKPDNTVENGKAAVLDVTHWVGAVKRNAEGSYMQLPD